MIYRTLGGTREKVSATRVGALASQPQVLATDSLTWSAGSAGLPPATPESPRGGPARD